MLRLILQTAAIVIKQPRSRNWINCWRWLVIWLFSHRHSVQRSKKADYYSGKWLFTVRQHTHFKTTQFQEIQWDIKIFEQNFLEPTDFITSFMFSGETNSRISAVLAWICWNISLPFSCQRDWQLVVIQDLLGPIIFLQFLCFSNQVKYNRFVLN